MMKIATLCAPSPRSPGLLPRNTLCGLIPQQTLLKVNNTVPFAISVEVMLLLSYSGDRHDSVTLSAKRHDSEHSLPDVKGIVTVLIVSGAMLHCSRQFIMCHA